MELKWKEKMTDAISEVMETMLFLPVEFSGDLPSQPNFWCQSNIEMKRGKDIHRISFFFVEPYAKMITANFLGKDETEISDDETGDTLKEIANMVCGSFLYQSGEKDIQLGIPDFVCDRSQPEKDVSEALPLFMDEELVGVVLMYPGSG